MNWSFSNFSLTTTITITINLNHFYYFIGFPITLSKPCKVVIACSVDVTAAARSTEDRGAVGQLFRRLNCLACTHLLKLLICVLCSKLSPLTEVAFLGLWLGLCGHLDISDLLHVLLCLSLKSNSSISCLQRWQTFITCPVKLRRTVDGINSSTVYGLLLFACLGVVVHQLLPLALLFVECFTLVVYFFKGYVISFHALPVNQWPDYPELKH